MTSDDVSGNILLLIINFKGPHIDNDERRLLELVWVGKIEDEVHGAHGVDQVQRLFNIWGWSIAKTIQLFIGGGQAGEGC